MTNLRDHRPRPSSFWGRGALLRGSPAGTDAGGTRHGGRLGARSEHPPTRPATALSVGLKNATALSKAQKHRNCFVCRLALGPAIASPPRAAARIADAVPSRRRSHGREDPVVRVVWRDAWVRGIGLVRLGTGVLTNAIARAGRFAVALVVVCRPSSDMHRGPVPMQSPCGRSAADATPLP